MTVIHRDPEYLKELSPLSDYMKYELCLKEIKFRSDLQDWIKLSIEPNFEIIGKRLGKDKIKIAKTLQELETKVKEKGEKIYKNVYGDLKKWKKKPAGQAFDVMCAYVTGMQKHKKKL